MTQDNRVISVSENKRVSDVTYFQDGAIVKVDIKPSGLKKKKNYSRYSC